MHYNDNELEKKMEFIKFQYDDAIEKVFHFTNKLKSCKSCEYKTIYKKELKNWTERAIFYDTERQFRHEQYLSSLGAQIIQYN